MKKEWFKFIPFGIASLLVLVNVIQTLLTPGYINEDGIPVTYSVISSVQYTGFGLAIVLTLILVKNPSWKYVFVVITILALTPWFSFYSNTFSVGIGIISIELTAFGLLILHLILNPEVFDSLKKLIVSEPESEESKQAKFESAVDRFKSRYSDKSTDELQDIVEQGVHVPEAVEAARRILEQR